MMRRPSHSPFGWAAVLLIVVAYAHVILEIAVALLAIGVTARVIMSPAPGLMATHLARWLRRGRARRQIAGRRAALERRMVERPANVHEEVER